MKSWRTLKIWHSWYSLVVVYRKGFLIIVLSTARCALSVCNITVIWAAPQQLMQYVIKDSLKALYTFFRMSFVSDDDSIFYMLVVLRTLDVNEFMCSLKLRLWPITTRRYFMVFALASFSQLHDLSDSIHSCSRIHIFCCVLTINCIDMV